MTTMAVIYKSWIFISTWSLYAEHNLNYISLPQQKEKQPSMGETEKMKEMSNEVKIFNNKVTATNINDRYVTLIETYSKDVVIIT